MLPLTTGAFFTTAGLRGLTTFLGLGLGASSCSSMVFGTVLAVTGFFDVFNARASTTGAGTGATGNFAGAMSGTGVATGEWFVAQKGPMEEVSDQH